MIAQVGTTPDAVSAFLLWTGAGSGGRLDTVAGPELIREDLAKTIRRLRQERGMTLDGLADLSGMHSTYLSRIERCHACR